MVDWFFNRIFALQGSTEQHQLALITKLCGSITPEVWPAVESLDLYTKMELTRGQKRRVIERLQHYVRDNLVMLQLLFLNELL